MRDHYEVLGIEEDADNSQIKKAYRKLALKYHPDKNQGNEESVTKLFREVQNAYDVLMDPQERAWYDKHKDAILMKSGEYEDNEVSISEFFSPFCYTGFEDDDNGFYSVYGKLFKDISEEDYKFMNADEDDYPQFGDSKTDPVFVVQVFYGYWQSYSTKKTYVWEEEYDTRDAPNRWVRRKMEQENNKVTDQHRKDRSKSVQALVDFVRRRDPRIKEYRRVLEEKQKLNDEKAKRKREEKLLEDLVKAAQYEKDNAERLEEERRQLEALERELGFDSETESLYSDDSQTLDITNENLEDLSETEKQKIREEMLRDEELIQNIQAAKDKKNMSKKQKKKQRQIEPTKNSDNTMTNSPKQSKTLSKKQKKN